MDLLRGRYGQCGSRGGRLARRKSRQSRVSGARPRICDQRGGVLWIAERQPDGRTYRGDRSRRGDGAVAVTGEVHRVEQQLESGVRRQHRHQLHLVGREGREHEQRRRRRLLIGSVGINRNVGLRLHPRVVEREMQRDIPPDAGCERELVQDQCRRLDRDQVIANQAEPRRARPTASVLFPLAPGPAITMARP